MTFLGDGFLDNFYEDRDTYRVYYLAVFEIEYYFVIAFFHEQIKLS